MHLAWVGLMGRSNILQLSGHSVWCGLIQHSATNQNFCFQLSLERRITFCLALWVIVMWISIGRASGCALNLQLQCVVEIDHCFWLWKRRAYQIINGSVSRSVWERAKVVLALSTKWVPIEKTKLRVSSN